MTTLDSGALDRAQEPADAPPGSVWGLLGQALLLNGAAYMAIREHRAPFRRGLVVLLAILGSVGLARLVGLGLGLLAAPQLGSLQQIGHDFLTGLSWYARQVRLDAEFATQFELGYTLAWDVIRLLLGVPVPLVVGGLYLALVIFAVVHWLLYGVLAHLFARWFGGQGRFNQTLGVLALAYVPLLLLVVEAVPGASIPLGLLLALLLISQFLAIGRVQGLRGGAALAVALAPYLASFVMVYGAVLFASAYRLQQIPYLDMLLRLLPQLSLLTRLF